MKRIVHMIRVPLFLTVVSLFLLAWGTPEKPLILQGKTMGTYWQVSIAEPDKTVDEKALQEKIEAQLQAVNQSMSTYIPDSELMQFNHNTTTEPVAISPELRQVVAKALTVSGQSDGIYDVTVAPLVDLWGFGKKKVTEAPTEAEIAQALQNVGYQQLKLTEQGLAKRNPNVQVDLSSIAKGFGVDEVARVLNEQGLHHFLVDIGGEMRLEGSRFGETWRIGVEVPEAYQRKVETVIRVKDRHLAMATSGNYRNFTDYEGVHAVHTINPKTGQGVVSKLLSVTVISDDCMTADAYATALMALGDSEAESFAEKMKLPVLFIFAGKEKGQFDVRSSSSYNTVVKGE